VRVIVNADDLGLSTGVDGAILSGLDEGWLSDASVIVTGPSFVDTSAALAGRAVGLHVDVSEFPPLTRALDKWLPGRPVHWPLGARAALVAEMNAQAERLLQTGARISHIDSHQHLHWQPVVLDAVASVAKQHGVRWVRGVGAVPPVGLRRMARAHATGTRLRLAGLWSSDGFGPAARVKMALESGWRVDTLEVMCHPGRDEPVYADEIDWLRSDPWAHFGVVLCPYQGLA